MTTPGEVVVTCSDPENRHSVADLLTQLGVDAISTLTVEPCREAAKAAASQEGELCLEE